MVFGPPMMLQRARCFSVPHRVFSLSYSRVCACARVCHILLVPLSITSWVSSVSWLLYLMQQRAWRCSRWPLYDACKENVLSWTPLSRFCEELTCRVEPFAKTQHHLELDLLESETTCEMKRRRDGLQHCVSARVSQTGLRLRG